MQILTPSDDVHLLILGSGWVSTYLITLLNEHHISYKGTKRSVTPEQTHMIQFSFDPESSDPAPFSVLPSARTLVVTFPIKGLGASKKLVDLYMTTHSRTEPTHFVQLGSTGMWDVSDSSQGVWKDRHSPYDKSNIRAQAEDELISLSSSSTPTTVLNLCGLWGGSRQPKNWLDRVAPSKDALGKRGSLHLIHGADVARAILAVHQEGASANTSGQRWIITNSRIYDWWDVAASWGGGSYPLWVRELMMEQNVRALPRAPELLGRALDGREFWETFSMEPSRTRLDQD